MKTPRVSRRVAITSAVIAAVAAGGSAAALATSGSSGDVYEGCLSHALGALYNVKVNPQTTPRCLPHDALVKWNQTGPAGAAGAPGATGPAGPKGDTGAGLDGAQWYYREVQVTAGLPYQATHSCGDSRTAVSGGVAVVGGDPDHVAVTDNSPVVFGGNAGTVSGWYQRVRNNSTSDATVHLWWLCAPVRSNSPVQSSTG